MEAELAEFKKYLEDERKTHQSEHLLIAELLTDILESDGSVDLLKSSLEEFMEAAKTGLDTLEDLFPSTVDPNLTEEERQQGMKAFVAHFQVRHHGGTIAVDGKTAEDAVEAVQQIEVEFLHTNSPKISVDVSSIFEIDEKGKMIEGTLVDFEV